MRASNVLGADLRPRFFLAGEDSIAEFAAPEVPGGESLRAWLRCLAGMQKEALIRSARTGACWRLTSDEGAYLAGFDEAPCPLSFMTVGMISATLRTLLALAREQHIELRQLRLVQDNFYTMTGSALQGTMLGGARDVRLTAQIDSPVDAATLTRLVAEAVSASPVSALLRSKMPSRFGLEHNGHSVAPGRVLALEAAQPNLPGTTFPETHPWANGSPVLLRRSGPSPKVAQTTTLAGDSLSPQQDRLLHLRGICTLDADGMSRVEVQMFNPHGTVYHFLSEETDAQGRPGRAPDALTYVAAGLGFCFMTQFGRFATITRQDLRDYQIVQDMRFVSGEAHAVETQVRLATGENDDAARRMLDMAEQTCFLHALCREVIRTRVMVQTAVDGHLAPLPDTSAH